MFSGLLRWCETALFFDEQPPRLRVCDGFADVQVRNQFNEEFRFHRRFVRDGGALLINTMYTTCRGSCPVTNSVLESLRKSLWPIFGDRLSIVSLSVEPAIDVPEKLRSYAESFGADRPRRNLCEWHFLTGTEKHVETLRRSLGFYDLDPRVDRDPTQHAAALMFGNVTFDRWAVLPAASKESQLITTIRRIAGFTFEERYGIPG